MSPGGARSVSKRTERLAGAVLVGAAVVAIGVAVVIAAPRYMTADDAKYIGIGTNLLAGAGPTTVFGVFFPYHSPLWPLIVTLPHAWFGIDPAAWSHALNVLSLLVIVSLAAYLGWRVRPLVGGITAVAVVGFGYFLELGRGMGLDLPASALTLLYVVVGRDAIERRSLGRALLAGLLFSAAFLIKEIALSYAPVPFLAAALTGPAWRPIIRCAGASLLAALPGVGWWFAIFALETNKVYRLGVPAWTLLPLGIAALIIGVSAISIDRIRPAQVPRSTRRRYGAPVIGWGLAAAWCVVLLAFFAVTRWQVGQSFAEPGQLFAHARQQFTDIAPVAGFGVGGLALLVVCHSVAGASDGRRELVVASIAGLPLVLLVASVGELPRHYVVQSVLLLALGASGWVTWMDWILTRRPAAIVLAGVGGALLSLIALETVMGRMVDGPKAIIAAIGGCAVWIGVAIAGHVGLPRPALTAVTLMTLFAALGLGSETLRATRPGALDEPKAVAVAQAAAWIQANVPAGDTIAFEVSLAYETAIAIQGTHQAIRIREFQDVQFDPAGSLGLGRHGEPPADDWILLFKAPGREDLLYGYRAGALESQFRDHAATLWVLYNMGQRNDRAEFPIAEILDGAPGIEKAAQWSTAAADSAITTTVLRIDPAALELDGRPLVGSPAAVAFIVDQLERLHASAAQPIAARLIERGIVIAGATNGASLSLHDRLRRLAGGQAVR